MRGPVSPRAGGRPEVDPRRRSQPVVNTYAVAPRVQWPATSKHSPSMHPARRWLQCEIGQARQSNGFTSISTGISSHSRNPSPHRDMTTSGFGHTEGNCEAPTRTHDACYHLVSRRLSGLKGGSLRDRETTRLHGKHGRRLWGRKLRSTRESGADCERWQCDAWVVARTAAHRNSCVAGHRPCNEVTHEHHAHSSAARPNRDG
jgi:hypothetical protein